ncbi:hypothetical protein EK904_012616, partial [Melospiza melodia maxima]
MQILSVIGGVVKVEETDLKSRVGFLHPIETRNISLLINATREQDSGQYMCTVNVVDDIIRMHKNVGLINLTVLVPPATPTCQLHGNAVVGANVTLSCSSKKGKPSPMYQWQREPPTLQVFFPPAQGKVAPVWGWGVGWNVLRRFRFHLLDHFLHEEVEGVGVAVRQHPNFSPADRAKGTLKLTNLSLEMSGVYVCRAENQAGSENCSIVLEVQSTSTKAVIAGAVLGSL